MNKLFPSVLILLDLGASVVYLVQKDYRHAVYWFSAATLTAAVTF